MRFFEAFAAKFNVNKKLKNTLKKSAFFITN